MERRTTKLPTRAETPSWYVAKRVIRTHGLTLKEFGERINLSMTTVYSIVNNPPSIIHVKMMADALGCSFFDFFDFSDQSTMPPTLSYRPTDNTFTCPHCNQQFTVVPISEEVQEKE